MSHSENFILGRMDRDRQGRTSEQKRDLMLEKVGMKARETLQSRQIKMSDFNGEYGEGAVKKDSESVAQIQKNIAEKDAASFQKEGHDASAYEQVAHIFEAIVAEGIDKANWLGSNVKAIKTSPYDDLLNGTDIIAEFVKHPEPDSYLGLAMDVTFGGRLQGKFLRIKQDIEHDRLANIKYFKSRNGDVGLELVPKVIVGSSIDQVSLLGRLWLSEREAGLAKHPIQHLVLEEIIRQLKVFSKYAKSLGKEKIVAQYEKALHILERVRQEKLQKVPKGEVMKDRSLRLIEEGLNLFDDRT